MAHRKDYLTASFAGCFRDYRNTPGPVWARVTYANQTVRVCIYDFSPTFDKKIID